MTTSDKTKWREARIRITGISDYGDAMTTVHVLTAIENSKVKECIVIPHDEVNVEFGVRNALYEIYGAANVCASSREVGYIPSNVSRFLAEKSIGVHKEDKWIPNSEVSRPASGKRVLVKLSNDWVCCATYFFVNTGSLWKADNGQELIGVVSWKGLEE